MQEVRARAFALDPKNSGDFERRMAMPDVTVYLRAQVKHIRQADAIVVINADGLVVNSSRGGVVEQINAFDRDYYQYFREHDDPGMYIGALSKGRVTGDPSLYFARRINGPDGAFFGLVLGVVDIRYLSDFYRTATEHLGMSVTLARRDGAMLIRYPNTENAVGVFLPPQSPWHGRVAEGGGSYITPGILDGISSLVTVHPLRDYPLVVDVLEPEATVYAKWRTDAVYITGATLLVALAFSGLIWIVMGQKRIQQYQHVILKDTAARLHDGQERLRAYAEMSADWFWEQDADLRFRFNSQIPFVTGTDDTGKTRRDLADPGMSNSRWVLHEAELAARGPFRNFRWERIGADGCPHFMSTNGDPVFDPGGTFTGYRGTGRDLTAEVRANERLAETNGRLAEANANLEMGHRQIEAVLTNITHGVCLFDGAERLKIWNQRWVDIYDLPIGAACVGRSIQEIMDIRTTVGSAMAMSSTDYEAWRTEIRARTTASGRVITLRNGRVVAIHFQPMPDGGWVSTHEDITARQQDESRLAFLALHDALTQLANRTLFHERLEQAILMAGRGREFAIISLDLDRFKAVNDTMGHPVGDGLLKAVAHRISFCVREGDTVARLGGDEFAIIQLDVGPGHASLLVDRIHRAFREPFNVEGHHIDIGVSMGVAMAPGDGSSPERLLQNVDVALYHAKADGRGEARFFETEMNALVDARRTLECDLRDAISRGEFELYYQPLINLTSGSVSGFEALLRWRHPIRGLVSPVEFIAAAEETGMIVAIGEWVLRAACFEAENWPDDISVAVNLSPIQFERGEIVATVQAALAASGLRADRLELEITESVLLRDTDGTMASLLQLRAMGIAVALDDFGTGYSSLSYLRSFPFDKIKIDQSFIRDLVTNKESMSIVRAVTGLGHSLDIKTTAEGVETLDQLNLLREHGCTEAQGYLFSRPVPTSELPMLIGRLHRINALSPVPDPVPEARPMRAVSNRRQPGLPEQAQALAGR